MFLKDPSNYQVKNGVKKEKTWILLPVWRKEVDVWAKKSLGDSRRI